MWQDAKTTGQGRQVGDTEGGDERDGRSWMRRGRREEEGHTCIWEA